MEYFVPETRKWIFHFSENVYIYIYIYIYMGEQFKVDHNEMESEGSEVDSFS